MKNLSWGQKIGLPALDTERVTLAQVERMFSHLDQPDLPTDFD